MDEVISYFATVFVGRKHRASGRSCSYHRITRTVQTYVNLVGLCVTVTPTRFYYVNGWEKGVAIGFINYPRFPSTPETIEEQALELAEILRQKCKQLRVSVVFPQKTIMLSERDSPERRAFWRMTKCMD